MIRKVKAFLKDRHDMGWLAEILAWLMVISTIIYFVQHGAPPMLLTGAIFAFVLYGLAEVTLALISAVIGLLKKLFIKRVENESQSES